MPAADGRERRAATGAPRARACLACAGIAAFASLLLAGSWRELGGMDNTLSMDGEDRETDLGFLAGHLVTVARCLVTPNEPPWIEHEGKRFALHRVDPVKNAHRPRPACNLDVAHEARVPFDPPKALLDKALGRTPRGDEEG